VAWLLPEFTQRIASQTRILSGFRKFHSADEASPRKSHLLSCSSPLMKVLSLLERLLQSKGALDTQTFLITNYFVEPSVSAVAEKCALIEIFLGVCFGSRGAGQCCKPLGKKRQFTNINFGCQKPALRQQLVCASSGTSCPPPNLPKY